jgi:hypothetical protein
MGTETVTQYETVEREEEVMFCDDCSANEDERPVIPVSIHAHRGEKKETQGMKYQGYEPALVKDLCAECIEQQFDLNIPDEGKVESFNIQSNGVVKVKNKIKKNAIFPGLKYKLRRYFVYDTILMPVIFIVATLGNVKGWDEETGWHTEENEDYAFVVGVLGATVWILMGMLACIVLLLSSIFL